MIRDADRADATPSFRGVCPSVHAPFLEPDGELFRVRLPGGALVPAGARTIADAIEAAGGTAIELTNRANLQLRGVPATSGRALRDVLVGCGLVAGDALVDEHRNLLTSPTAGIDPDELVDATRLTSAILERLTSPAALALSPKFGVLLDGGGTVHVRDRAHDVSLGAVGDALGRVAFEVRLAGALASAPAADEPAPGWVVRPEGVPAFVDAVVELTRAHGHGRVRALLDDVPASTVWAELTARTDALEQCSFEDRAPSGRPSVSPVGVRVQRQVGLASVGATVPLGRIDAPTLRAVADLADSVAATEVRVTPWRQLLLVGVARDDGPRVERALASLDLIVDPTHPAGSVAVCAGVRGCASGHTDTLSDAAALIADLLAIPASARPASIHVSGCEKGCASPERTDVALVGTADGTYDVHDGRQSSATDTAERRFGRRGPAGLAPLDARCAVLEVGLGAPSVPYEAICP